jgi:hypothetical protein
VTPADISRCVGAPECDLCQQCARWTPGSMRAPSDQMLSFVQGTPTPYGQAWTCDLFVPMFARQAHRNQGDAQ